jgi:hypothetical protein
MHGKTLALYQTKTDLPLFSDWFAPLIGSHAQPCGVVGVQLGPQDIFAQFWVSWVPNSKSFAAHVLLFFVFVV